MNPKKHNFNNVKIHNFFLFNRDSTIKDLNKQIEELTRKNKELTKLKSVNYENSIKNLNKMIALEKEMYGILINI